MKYPISLIQFSIDWLRKPFLYLSFNNNFNIQLDLKKKQQEENFYVYNRNFVYFTKVKMDKQFQQVKIFLLNVDSIFY
jgi:hypothetical protein